MNNCDFRACVIEVILVIRLPAATGLTIVITAPMRGAKPRPNKLRTVRQDQRHAIFDTSTKLTQRVTRLIRESCYLAVRSTCDLRSRDRPYSPDLPRDCGRGSIGHVERSGNDGYTAREPTLSFDPERFFLEIALTQLRLPGYSN